MPLQSFIDKQLPTIKAAWLNSIDAFYTTLFGSATTAQQARTAILPSQAGKTNYLLSSDATDVHFTYLATTATTAGTIPIRNSSGSINGIGFWINVLDYGAVGDNNAASATANVTAINNALAAVPATGGTVFFPAGVYYIDNTLNVKSYTTILGCGYGSMIKAKSGMTGNAYFISIGAGSQPIALMNANPGTTNVYINVSHLAFDLGLLAVGTGFCMHFRNANYVEVTNCNTLAGEDGISFTACTHFIVANNTCYGHTNAAIDCWEGSLDGIIQGNQITCLIGSTVSYGILATGMTVLNAAATTRRITIVGNSIYHPSLTGIWLQGGVSGTAVGSCTDCIVANNTITEVQRFHGIRASDGLRHIINNNIIYGATGIGIVLQGEPASTTGSIQIAGTTSVVGTGTNFTSVAVAGMYIIANGETRIINTISTATALTVTVAFTSSAGPGLSYAIGSSGAQACTIEGNQIQDAATAGSNAAIDIGNGASKTLVQGNHVARAGAYYTNACIIRAGASDTVLGLNYWQAGTSGTMSNLGTTTKGGGFQTDWAAVAFLNAANDVYVNFGGAYQTCQYMRDAQGFVHLRGTFGGTAGNTSDLVFILPAGFRPPAAVEFSVVSMTTAGFYGTGLITIAPTNGHVTVSPVLTDTSPNKGVSIDCSFAVVLD